MPRSIDPDRWQTYAHLRTLNYPRDRAAAIAGISPTSARAFDRERKEEAAGRPSARRSSGWRWLEQASVKP